MARGDQKHDEAEALRGRLRLIAEQHSQNEIARRTGASKANVHRHLRAGRVPADFLQRLVHAFGLNPSWLLLGRGEMLEARVSEAAAAESQQLLELVVKLNAVGHERIGAMGEAPARMVRELADALARNQELLKRIMERARPVFLKLLNDYRTLIGEHRHQETAEVLPALRQLVKLTQNPSMQANVDMLEAVQCFFEGDYTRQRELHRSALAALLNAGRLRDAQFMRLTYNTCVGLASAGRLSESARLANAALQLADSEPPRWVEDWLLRVPQAVLDMQTGKLGPAMQELSRVVAACGGEIAENLRDALLFCGFLAGMTPLEEVARRWTRMAVGSPPLLLLGLWSREDNALQRVRRTRVNMQGHLDARSRRLLEAADAVLEGAAFPEVASTEPVLQLELQVIECEAQVRAGNTRAARKLFEAAGQAMQSLDAEFLPDFLVRAMHARHALELGDEAARERAAAFVRDSLTQGYGFLRALAETHEIQSVGMGAATPAG
ncbi:MAG: helix-turn-helix transcriptional regulator [Planctomycetes bacterium]|nr:helix-turn-helix transcriptional regulator [Planctomycetota bacterium]MCB9936533.1 helix-turn-helix transcriptional regulator [Planctomycetota bacterium]